MSDSPFPILETEPLADGIGMLAHQARIGGTMTEQRLTIRAELARRMGNHVWFTDGSTRWLSTKSGMAAVCRRYPEIRETDEEMPIDWQESDIPDPFTNAEDKEALVEWLAADDARWTEFTDQLFIQWNKVRLDEKRNVKPSAIDWERFILTAPREVITLAAARALGIQEAGE